MSARMLDGWGAISAHVSELLGIDASPDTCRRLARRADDPLPVKKWGRRRVAEAAAIERWAKRNDAQSAEARG